MIDEDCPFGRTERNRRLEPTIAALREAERLTVSSPGIDGIALRYGLFYGAGGPLEALVATLRKRQLPLPAQGSGTHSFIWLPDAAAATVAALDRGMPGRAYNVCDDQPVAFDIFVEAVADPFGAPRPRRLPLVLFRALPYAYHLMTSTIPMSNGRAERELGWQPTAATLHDGLAADRTMSGSRAA